MAELSPRSAAIAGHALSTLMIVACVAVGAYESDSTADWLVLLASIGAGCALLLAYLRVAPRATSALLRPEWVVACAFIVALLLDLPGPVDQIVFGLGAGFGLGFLVAAAVPGSATSRA